jgi:hypothetical protein
MFKLIFFITVILLVVFIIALIAVGLCMGIAYLMIYLIPTIELVNALVPRRHPDNHAYCYFWWNDKRLAGECLGRITVNAI